MFLERMKLEYQRENGENGGLSGETGEHLDAARSKNICKTLGEEEAAMVTATELKPVLKCN